MPGYQDCAGTIASCGSICADMAHRMCRPSHLGWTWTGWSPTLLFGSTPGLRNSQAATWLPRIAKEGLRGFFAATIADRLPLDRVPKGLVTWFVDEAGKNDPAWITRFVGLMSTLEWSERLGEIRCPTLVVMPGGETVGSIKNYDAMIERIPDVQAIAYEGLPHNICDAVPDRCVADVLAFLRWRFREPAC